RDAAQMRSAVGRSDDGAGGELDRAVGRSQTNVETTGDVRDDVANQGIDDQCIRARLAQVWVKTDGTAGLTTSGWQQQSSANAASAQVWRVCSHLALAPAAIGTNEPIVNPMLRRP